MDLECVWSPMKNLCLCRADLLLRYNIFACWRIFLFGCFLKRKLCSILFSVFLTLLLQTSRKWGIGVGMSPVSEVAEPDVTDVRLLQSESLFQAATLREGLERHWRYSGPVLLCVSWVQNYPEPPRPAGTTECFRELIKAWFCCRQNRLDVKGI